MLTERRRPQLKAGRYETDTHRLRRIRGRILAIVHFIGGACVWPIASLFTLAFRDQIGWRGVWIVIGIGAIIVWLFRFALPESPRYLSTHGRGKEALDVLARLGIAGPKEPLATSAASDTKSDPFALVFKMFPTRVIAGMICFSAFFGVAIGLGTWLPNIMTEKGFTITKSLTYTFGMTLAVPCASVFMMFALDHFGRKITSVCAFIAAGLMAIVFANAATDTQLLIAGFIMIFFIQVAGNSTFRVELTTTGVRNATEIERAIDAIAGTPDGGIIILPGPAPSSRRDRIIALAERHRLPAVYAFRYWVVSGGLASYGIDNIELYRLAATYVDRILKGEKPADLPVQHASKFQLVINLKTAKALGLELPITLLARTDEVIE